MNCVEFGPAVQVFLPLLGNLRENTDARAHILAPLGVVRGGGVHAVGPVLLTLLQKKKKLFLGGGGGGLGGASNLVQGQQWIVYIEGSVFDSLRHDRSGELLPAHDE